LEPAWEAATKAVHEKYPEGADGRIRFAKVDCTQEEALCRAHFITGFPSIRVFRRGHDDIYIQVFFLGGGGGGGTLQPLQCYQTNQSPRNNNQSQQHPSNNKNQQPKTFIKQGTHQHESYLGDRTKEALEAFADSLVPSAGLPHARHGQLVAAPKVHGCNLAGFVLVKRVPGTLHFVARGEGHSFDFALMNMTHVVHAFYFGARPTPRKLWELRKLHPLGLPANWLDKLAGQRFFSDHPQHTHEHVLQVVKTTVEPRRHARGAAYDAYEYTAHSHTYVNDAIPTAKFSYDPSPIQVVVRELPRRYYHFLTTLCAIIGGVFTVAGIIDGILHSTLRLAKKMEIGKAI
jgi:hypothetical protein